MRHPGALLIVAFLALAACQPAPQSGTTNSPPPHVAAGIDSDALNEGERLYLDDLLPKAPDTEAGTRWKKTVTSKRKSDLDMLFDGERLTFCKASRRDKSSFTGRMGQEEGYFAFQRQEATQKNLC
ncbi:hypothetical protein [Streptomyces sp. NPDC102487]|uniref:hypothetical protein n=1 Tax=Streptomyces sp. NPDC102487 TaxID=3366182 RepID=UPI0038243FE1